MTRDYIDIGPTPAYENCQQVGTPNYNPTLAREECSQFIIDIIDALGNPPEQAQLSIKSQAHDFGRYYEVVCYFEPNDQPSIDYAFNCEANAPTQWSQRAREALAIATGKES